MLYVSKKSEETNYEVLTKISEKLISGPIIVLKASYCLLLHPILQVVYARNLDSVEGATNVDRAIDAIVAMLLIFVVQLTYRIVCPISIVVVAACN